MKRKRFVGVLLGMLAASCADGVGAENCVGVGVRCEVPDVVDKPAREEIELATKDLEELSPTWIRPLPIQPPDPIYGTTMVRGDLKGDVWFFTQSGGQLVASKLDADGQMSERGQIEAPDGWELLDSGFVSISSAPQSAVGAVLHVNWPLKSKTRDEKEADNVASSGDHRSIDEWIKVGTSLDDPLQRIVPERDSTFYTSDLIWDGDGSVFALTQPNGQSGLGLPLSIEKFDRKLNRIWKQSALNRSYGDAYVWFGLFQDHRVAAFVQHASTSFSIGVLGPDGNIEPWFGRAISSLVNLDSRYVFAQQGPTGPVLVANNAVGDLIIATMSAKPRSLKLVTLLREDYASLASRPNAVDRLGNVYVAPMIGGRAVSEARRAICRVPVMGEPRCFVLARSAELEAKEDFYSGANSVDLAVHANGVVFMRVGSALIRIDFPEV